MFFQQSKNIREKLKSAGIKLSLRNFSVALNEYTDVLIALDKEKNLCEVFELYKQSKEIREKLKRTTATAKSWIDVWIIDGKLANIEKQEISNALYQKIYSEMKQFQIKWRKIPLKFQPFWEWLSTLKPDNKNTYQGDIKDEDN